MARFDSKEDRRRGYKTERGFRWALEDFFRDPVMEFFCKAAGSKIEFSRNDEAVTSASPKEVLPDWLKGTPDYRVFGKGGSALVELKVKTEKFRKSKYDGSDFPGYTSESHYIDPYVIDQIQAHCGHEKIQLSSVLILFAFDALGERDFEQDELDSSHWEFGFLPFDSIVNRIKEGKYVQIPLRDSGYGEPSYLVPVNHLKPPPELSRFLSSS